MDPNNLLALTYHISPISSRPVSDPTKGLEDYISQGIGLLTVAAVVYFTIQIILAGFAFFTSEGDEKKLETARRRITDNLTGVLIVIAAVTLASLMAKVTGIGDIFDLDQMFTNMGL
ncbi:MAG: hypothetical protein WC686_04260 [Candidatus Shapirobacteria bacterium]|jgi:hypothetical protein